MQKNNFSQIFIILGTALFLPPDAAADVLPAPTSRVHRVLDCGPIVATSDTRLSGLNDEFNPQGLSQTIQLLDTSTHRSVKIPLFQHWSRNRKLHGRKVLDGLIWAFSCVTSARGETYVLLHWDCKNPDATTCEEAMDIRDEWIAVYDRFGQSLPKNPRDMTPSDERKLLNLGLWHSLIHDDIDKDDGLTYYYVQVKPNGHIQ